MFLIRLAALFYAALLLAGAQRYNAASYAETTAHTDSPYALQSDVEHAKSAAIDGGTHHSVPDFLFLEDETTPIAFQTPVANYLNLVAISQKFVSKGPHFASFSGLSPPSF